MIEAGGVRVTWTYDNIYRLTREQRGGANSFDITYSYDVVGNRRTKLEDSVHTTYGYDAANQLRYHDDNTGRTTYTFDASGNQQIVRAPDGARTTHTWDYENRLAKILLPSGVRNTFSFEADGHRIQKSDSAGTSKFLWDAENVLLETNASDVTQVVYTVEPETPGNLLSQYRTGTSRFFHFDGLGSTDRLTDVGTTVTDNYVDKAFGAPVLVAGTTTNAFRFVGRQGYYLDLDLSQYEVRKRPYAPTTGRWLTLDPFGFTDGPNRYSYVLNRPTCAVDPFGLQFSACTAFRNKGKLTPPLFDTDNIIRLFKILPANAPIGINVSCEAEWNVEVRGCLVCCPPLKYFESTAYGEKGACTFKITFRKVRIPPVPVPLDISFFAKGEKGRLWRHTCNDCHGKCTDSECTFVRFSGGIEGCVSFLGGKGCVKGEGFWRKQCCDGVCKTCSGGRVSVEICWGGIWGKGCWEWVILQTANCDDASGG